MENNPASAIDLATILVFAAIWFIGFASSVSQTVRDDVFKSCGHTIAVGFCSGFFCIGVCSVFGHYYYRIMDHPSFYCGLSAILGLSGKQQESLLKQVLEVIVTAASNGFNTKKQDQ